jgi:hypothetical protein
MRYGRPCPVAQHDPELGFVQLRTGGKKITERFGIPPLPRHFWGSVILGPPVLCQNPAKAGMPGIDTPFCTKDACC